jgi:Glycosyltransferase family 87
MAIAGTDTKAVIDGREADRSAIRLLAWTGGLFFVLTTATYVATIAWGGPIPRDATTLVVGRDFLNFWMYGRAAWQPQPGQYYDPHIYNAALAALLGDGYPGQNWSYPPSVMLLAAPFGRLGYLPALLCWTVFGAAIFAWVIRRSTNELAPLVAILLSPAVVFCLVSGQSSFLTAAMLLTILSCLDRRPLLAGLLIGLLTLKPQLGLLFPVMLVASGRWRVFMIAAVTALVLATLSAALFGPDAWADFVKQGLPVQNTVLADPERIGTRYYPTIFMNIRGIGAPYAAAMAIQAVFSLLAIGAVAFAYRVHRNADQQILTVLFLSCSICAVPYLLSYDTMAVMSVAVLTLVAGKFDATGRLIAKLVYWLPVIQMALGQFHVPGAALIPAAFAVYALTRLTPAPALHAALAR